MPELRLGLESADMEGRAVRIVAGLMAASVVAAAPAVLAQESGGVDLASRLALGWTVVGATDDISDGLTTTGHEPYAEARVTASFDVFRVEAAVRTEGSVPDAAVELLAGVSPTLGDVALDASLVRTVAPDEPSAEEWVADVNATVEFSGGTEVNLGVSLTAPDDGGEYVDLYASVTVPLAHDWTASAAVDVEPDDGSGGRYLQTVLGLAVPLPHDLELSGALGYEWFSDPASPDYVHWNAGVTWSALDGVAFDLRYHGNDLGTADCAAHGDHPCDHRLVATMTVSGDWPAGE